MRLNDGAPVWHASVSLQEYRAGALRTPGRVERAAVSALAGVGGDSEWWFWNARARVGHLRVPVTAGELLLLPFGVPENDAGHAGVHRPRTRA